MEFRLEEIARRLGAEPRGDGAVRIRGVAGLREAGAGDLSFLADPRYQDALRETRAAAVLVPSKLPAPSLPHVVVDDPLAAFLQIVALFHPALPEGVPGVHPSAVIAADARIGESASIGPHVVVESGATIGPAAVLLAGAYVGRNASVGAEAVLHPGAVLRHHCEIGARVIVHAGAVIGADGFGYVFQQGSHRKVPQVGKVVVEDDVEIGANTTIDRATFGVTRIGRGSKLDNLVHVGHNVEIGEHSILCAQVGISGSARLGRFVVLGGQAGLVGHIEVGDGSRVGAQSGVTKSLPPGETVSGYPAQNHTRASRVYAALRQLPEALRALRGLERRVAALDGQRPESGSLEKQGSLGKQGSHRQQNEQQEEEER
ncbi:MAG: UDP-3-O-(3-hydroxymyristoyl)glucosamine N-acyltransferase [Candidatus Eisenbacteria bacterium]|nr:UDP-3-O-(3-hydroxymyristoyl)glucosamine N-acyltransferase [Candidatus Eisenbacteria bacterium]